MKLTLFFKAKKAQLVGGLIGVAIAVIIGVGVAIPIVQETITDSNLTGITKTVVTFIPVMLGVAIMMGAVALFSGRR